VEIAEPAASPSRSSFENLKDDRNIGDRNAKKVKTVPIPAKDFPSADEELKRQYDEDETPVYLPCWRLTEYSPQQLFIEGLTTEQIMSCTCSRPRQSIKKSACCDACLNGLGHHTEECEERYKQFPEAEHAKVRYWMRKQLASNKTNLVTKKTEDAWIQQNADTPMKYIYSELRIYDDDSEKDYAPARESTQVSPEAEERQREDPWEHAGPTSQHLVREPDTPWPPLAEALEAQQRLADIPSPWIQGADVRGASATSTRWSRQGNDADSETVEPEADDDSWGAHWTGKNEEAPESEKRSSSRTSESRRPRRTRRIPGERRRGKPQVATVTHATVVMAIATLGGNMAEAHSFVQVCDQGEMKSAYMTIVILMCLLVAACAYIYKLHSLAKVSIKETPTVQTDKIRPVTFCAGSASKHSAPAAKRMSVVHSAHLPAWCKDIYMCGSIQLDKNSDGRTMINKDHSVPIKRTKNKYHVQHDCHALRNSEFVVQVSLCKLCENKHK
jgi:hypothetical protein